MFYMVKVISAVTAFLMLVSPLGKKMTEERKCEPKFSGSFIQSWMTSSWDDERWEKEVANMNDAGVEYLVLQCLADKASKKEGGEWTVYYDTDVDSLKDAYYPGDSLELALKHCEKAGIKVFVGLSMFADFWGEYAFTKQHNEVCQVAADMVEDIYSKYGDKYSSLYGWYYTPEISNGILCEISLPLFAKGINKIIDRINETDASKPLLLSPFYSQYLVTGPIITLANYVLFFKQVNFRDGDIFAPQDAIGAKWLKEKNLEMSWKVYKAAIDSSDADVKLWANCENFSAAFADSNLAGITGPKKTENTSYVTATLDRFVRQLEVASRYAENIITFSYNHYHSPDAVNPAFINTYLDYVENGFVLEKEAPATPENFKKTATDNGVELTWDEAEDNFGIAYYRIEKDGKFLVRVDKYYGTEKTVYTDEGGNAESTYTIEVFDAAGNSSGKLEAK